MHTITIAAKNYLSRAIVLAESYIIANPSDKFTILIVDATPGELESSPGYTIATPWDLSLDINEFRRMAMIYDVTELSTAVKPWALQMLLDRGAKVATYLDPDIVVYDSLQEIEKLSKKYGVVLTPHTVTPMPRDGLRPTEADIMSSGVFNLGFISVGSQSKDVLEWWQARLSRDSIAAPHQMLFVDQRWIDLLPGYFDHVVLRDPGYNVAYWNLDSRRLEKRDDKFYVNGRPLRFFHFSGYDPGTPWVLSKYVSNNPRVLLSEYPAVLELSHGYAQLIRSNSDDAETRPYLYSLLNDGTPVLFSVRKIYRAALIDAEFRGIALPPVPFVQDDSEVIAWFRAPLRVDGHLNRFLFGYWESRVDLRDAFPEPLGKDEVPLVDWAWAHVSDDPGIVAALLPSLEFIQRPKGTDTTELGLTLVGYFKAELGVGQMGRLLVDGAQASGLPFSTVTNSLTISRQNAIFQETSSGVYYPIVVAAVNADQFPAWADEVGRERLNNRYVVGMWAWEVDIYPDYAKAFELVDEIWTLSTFSRKAIAQATDKPVYVIPLPIPEPPPHEPLDRSALGLPEGNYFLFIFDYMSIFQRKNPIDVVTAFTMAFEEEGGPILVIKSINGDRFRADRDRLRLACSSRLDIFLIEDYLNENVLGSLMGEATAYVSLHRAEGYGLTIAEAMARARPVIATDYSGNTDFMTPETSLLVPYSLVSIPAGAEPYPATSRWAQPDLQIAANHMRWIIENSDDAIALGLRAKEHVARVGVITHLSTFIRERVAVITGTMASSASQMGVASSEDSISEAIELINSPADVQSASRFPRLARGFRHVILRVLAHHDEQQNLRLLALASAVKQIDARYDKLSAAIERLSSPYEKISVLENTVQTVASRYYDTAAIVDLHGRQMIDVVDRLDGLTATSMALNSELQARPYSNDPESLLVASKNGEITLGYSKKIVEGTSYASFEDAFRGSASFIIERLRPYLNYVNGQAPIIDLGCGRGEFLELLREQNIPSTGIDLDESMLDRCRASGLDVENAEAIEYLNSLAPSSVGGVTSFQVVEHIHPEQVRALFEASFRVLRSGGVMIAETVNPHSPAALKVFWLDLTHVRPLYPESLVFLARECGFDRAEIFFPNVAGTLDVKLRNSGEYALIAYKA